MDQRQWTIVSGIARSVVILILLFVLAAIYGGSNEELTGRVFQHQHTSAADWTGDWQKNPYAGTRDARAAEYEDVDEFRIVNVSNTYFTASFKEWRLTDGTPVLLKNSVVRRAKTFLKVTIGVIVALCLLIALLPAHRNKSRAPAPSEVLPRVTASAD